MFIILYLQSYHQERSKRSSVMEVNSQGSFYNPDRVRILVVVTMVMAVVIFKVVVVVEVSMVVEIQLDGSQLHKKLLPS